MYFIIQKNVILSYNWIKNYTQICFKKEICNRMISKNRFLKSTNLLLQDNLILILYLRAWILIFTKKILQAWRRSFTVKNINSRTIIFVVFVLQLWSSIFFDFFRKMLKNEGSSIDEFYLNASSSQYMGNVSEWLVIFCSSVIASSPRKDHTYLSKPATFSCRFV